MLINHRSQEPLSDSTPKDPTKTSNNSGIYHRLVVPIQARSNIGKSTEAIARCEWMNQRGVEWRGYDLDSFSRGLSRTYPEMVTFVKPSEVESDTIRILREVPKIRVTVIDPSPYMNRAIMKAMRMVKFHEWTISRKTRATVIIYPIDDLSDMDDVSETVEQLGSTVDWMVVRNRRLDEPTKFFDNSELNTALIQCNAAFLEIPKLLAETRYHIRAQEVRHGRGLSPAEILMNESLGIDRLHREVFSSETGCARCFKVTTPSPLTWCRSSTRELPNDL